MDPSLSCNDNFVAPILDYGSAVWGVDEFLSIKSVFYRGCRFFLGIGKHVTLYHKPLVNLAKIILRYMPKCDSKAH